MARSPLCISYNDPTSVLGRGAIRGPVPVALDGNVLTITAPFVFDKFVTVSATAHRMYNVNWIAVDTIIDSLGDAYWVSVEKDPGLYNSMTKSTETVQYRVTRV